MRKQKVTKQYQICSEKVKKYSILAAYHWVDTASVLPFQNRYGKLY